MDFGYALMACGAAVAPLLLAWRLLIWTDRRTAARRRSADARLRRHG